MAGRGYQGRGHRNFRKRVNPHPMYQPLPPIPLPPRPGQELSRPAEFQFRFQDNQARNEGYRYGPHRGRGSRGKGYFAKNSTEDISQYFNTSMLEDPWDQLIQEFNQSEALDSAVGMEVSETATKPGTLEIGTLKDKPSFSRIQIRNQDVLTPLSEFKPELSTDTSPLEKVPEFEPYIPAPPRQDQQEAIPLAEELISPFGASESKVLASLSTNESPLKPEPNYEPYVPTGFSEDLETYSPTKSTLTYVPNELVPNTTNFDSSS